MSKSFLRPTTSTSRKDRMDATVYHPDAEINAGIIRDSLAAEAADLAAGYPPRRWRCPCGHEHGRGHFLAIGQHRCLRCGYVGSAGVMFVDEGRAEIAA